jgi:hypothetical protein
MVVVRDLQALKLRFTRHAPFVTTCVTTADVWIWKGKAPAVLGDAGAFSYRMWARRDSNPRPLAPEASALSN